VPRSSPPARKGRVQAFVPGGGKVRQHRASSGPKQGGGFTSTMPGKGGGIEWGALDEGEKFVLLQVGEECASNPRKTV